MRKTYSDADALAGIDLTVEPGELLALLGPSGSGKTTLLRVIAGLEIPDEGRVFFGEDDVTEKPVQERRIGFVFQHYALFGHLSIFDNIAYGLRARRTGRPPKAVLRQRVMDLLQLVQLDGLEKRFPAQLSGGQRQRVALARALAVEPRVLLLDEPFGALDARVRKDLRRWLRDIHRETGQTTIFVTHDQDEALELADRVAVMNRGRLEQVGSPDAVYDEPQSAFVMGFVGESMRIPVRVQDGVPRLGERILRVPVTDAAEGEADLYVRPQDLRFTSGAEGGLTGRVTGIRRKGAIRRADIRLDGSEIDLEVDLREAGPAIGDAVALDIVRARLFPGR